MCQFVKQAFITKKIPKEMNESNIFLIQKMDHPTKVSQLRPICPSNVVIKVVSKIIANRLKSLMKDLVGESQSSFILG